MPELPFSQACENNKGPILEVIGQYFTGPGLILEIGCGTGQHAEHFAGNLPQLVWQPTDRPGHHELCLPRLHQARLPNLRDPLPLDVTELPWPVDQADGVFSANTAHIMSWPMVQAMFAGVGKILNPGGYFCLYGPFNENGRFTSESNAAFDASLKSRDPAMGIRDKADLDRLARDNRLMHIADYGMPANNQIRIWRRGSQ